jgi:aldose 1-epimerase
MSIATETFGTFEGARVDQFRLTSNTGVEVDIIGFGGIVRDWRVPIAGGKRSVVLGFETFEPYVTHSPHFGALVGRVANRIAQASFDLDGEHFVLVPNEGNNQLHGGPEGLGRRVWQGEADSAANSVRFTHTSPDGHMGYPGTVVFTATYTLTGNRLKLEFTGIPDRRTPVSLVQHQYFNLGTGADILDHLVSINASAYTETGGDLLLTGAILPVSGTQYDLRTPRVMRDAANNPIGYDINLALATGRDLREPIATAVAPDRSLTLKLWSDQPGVQFYNGLWTDVQVPGLGGRRYGKHSGFCLEDQAFPDALHHAHFPSIIASPDKPYAHWCEFEIG